jgi:hypothetical protein
MAFSNFVFLTFIIALAALFVWKAFRPHSLSWLNLALTVILGGWCGLIVWGHHNISSSIEVQSQSIKLLKEANLDGELRGMIQRQVEAYPAQINAQLFDHYYYFSGFGWMASGSYFVVLSVIYGVFKYFRSQAKSTDGE